VLVTLAHIVFLMHFRSILIVTLPLPLAVVLSFLAMYYAGISSNIMSLAAIAIAIGVLSAATSDHPSTEELWQSRQNGRLAHTPEL